MMRYTIGMKVNEHNELAVAIRTAIERDGRSLYAIAKAAELPYQSVHPFARGHRTDITLATADRLCKVLGLTLRPVRSRRRKTKGR